MIRTLRNLSFKTLQSNDIAFFKSVLPEPSLVLKEELDSYNKVSNTHLGLDG